VYFRTVIARSLSSRLRLLVINQFKQRYRRSLLGMGWMLVGPLLNTAVLSVAFNGLFRSSIALYPVYVMVGLIAWNFFAQTTTLGVDAAISGSGLLQRRRCLSATSSTRDVDHYCRIIWRVCSRSARSAVMCGRCTM